MSGVIAVIGANSQIGVPLLRRLTHEGIRVAVITREARPGTYRFVKDEARFDPPLSTAQAVINLAPLPTVESAVAMACCLDASRLIAFGSTGTHFKAKSRSAHERDFVRQQRDAEAVLQSTCAAANIDWTLFRPTMVYGAAADLNVAFIAAMLKRFGFFPVPAGREGRRQPVHVEDLAHACVAVLDRPETFRQSYDLGGGEVLVYSEMVRRVALGLGLVPRLPKVPSVLLKAALTVLRCAPRYRYLDAAMIDRMVEDLTVDLGPASRDFGYSPRPFHPSRSELLA